MRYFVPFYKFIKGFGAFMTDVRIKKKNELYIIVECDAELRYILNDYYSFEVSGYKYMPAYKNGAWDGKIRLFSVTGGQLYYGLLDHLTNFLKDNNYTYEISPDVNEKCNYDVDTYIKSLKLPFSLRDYQIDTVKECIFNNRKLILSPTSSGKSMSLYILANYYKDFTKVLIIFPNTSLVIQTKKEFVSYGMDVRLIHEIFEDREKQSDKPIVMSTWQGIYTQPKSYFKQYGCVQVDECFTPDTEILTNKGFVRFDCLDKTELVAQYDSDTNEISFVKPICYIENDYSGKLINASSDRRISLTTTPNHEILLFNKINHVKKSHKDVSYNNGNWTIKTCGLTTSNIKTELTELDKLLIAFQADGSLWHTDINGTLTLDFTFSKQRKINKFLDIMSKGDFNFREVKGTERNGNVKDKRRFLVSGISYAYKNISDYFNIAELSLDVCRQIIEEMVCWDGSITKNGLYYYSSTIKANVDFYQAMAVLCNYHTNQTVQVDNRSDTFNDVYRLFISKHINRIGCRGITKSEIDYNGKVYCVKVPTGNIVVRHNGKVVITGNCHTAVAKSLTIILQHLDQCKYRFGFTGTLDGAKANKLQLMGLFGDCKQVVTTTELIKNKQISDVFIKILILKHPYRMFATYTEELEYLVTHQIRNNFIKNLVSRLKGNTLVLFSRVEQQGLPLYEQFTKELPEKSIHLVYGKISSDERERIRQLVETEQNGVIIASYQTYQQGINIKNLHNIIFASPNKSRIRNLQSIGRGLRLHDSKQRATIYDIADNISVGNIKNYTIDHLMDRIKYYSEEELEFNITEIDLIKKK
jgi:superfamily II DNA or RNA helicase